MTESLTLILEGAAVGSFIKIKLKSSTEIGICSLKSYPPDGTNNLEPAARRKSLLKRISILSISLHERSNPIRDYLRYYFASKNAEDLTPNNEERLKIEIRNEINDTILHKSKIKKISFDKLTVVPQ